MHKGARHERPLTCHSAGRPRSHTTSPLQRCRRSRYPRKGDLVVEEPRLPSLPWPSSLQSLQKVRGRWYLCRRRQRRQREEANFEASWSEEGSEYSRMRGLTGTLRTPHLKGPHLQGGTRPFRPCSVCPCLCPSPCPKDNGRPRDPSCRKSSRVQASSSAPGCQGCWWPCYPCCSGCCRTRCSVRGVQPVSNLESKYTNQVGAWLRILRSKVTQPAASCVGSC